MKRIFGSESKKLNQQLYFESLFKVFRPIAITAALVIIMLMSYNMFKSNKISFSSALGEPEITLEQVVDPTLTLTMELTP